MDKTVAEDRIRQDGAKFVDSLKTGDFDGAQAAHDDADRVAASAGIDEDREAELAAEGASADTDGLVGDDGDLEDC